MAIIECQFGGVPRYIRYCTLYRDQRNAQSCDARQYDLRKLPHDITIRVNLFYVNVFERTPRQRMLIVIAVMRAASDLGRHFAASNVQPQYDQGAQTAIAVVGDPTDPNYLLPIHGPDGRYMGPGSDGPYSLSVITLIRGKTLINTVPDEETIVNNIYSNFQLPIPDFPYPSSLDLCGSAYLVQTPVGRGLIRFPPAFSKATTVDAPETIRPTPVGGRKYRHRNCEPDPSPTPVRRDTASTMPNRFEIDCDGRIRARFPGGRHAYRCPATAPPHINCYISLCLRKRRSPACRHQFKGQYC